jgi:hypothetical protein
VPGVGTVVEVRQRSLLDAVGAVAEIDRVQVGGQDLVLGPALLELPGERGLLELAADRAPTLHVGVLDELLCDGRSALDHLLVAHVLPDRAQDPVDVHAAVLVEALVLDRDDRLLHQRCDVARGNEDPALRAAQHGEDSVSLAVVHEPVDLALLEPSWVERGDLARDRGDEPEREREQREHEEDQEKGQQAQLANPAPRPRRRLRGGHARHENRGIVTVDSPVEWASRS